MRSQAYRYKLMWWIYNIYLVILTVTTSFAGLQAIQAVLSHASVIHVYHLNKLEDTDKMLLIAYLIGDKVERSSQECHMDWPSVYNCHH